MRTWLLSRNRAIQIQIQIEALCWPGASVPHTHQCVKGSSIKRTQATCDECSSLPFLALQPTLHCSQSNACEQGGLLMLHITVPPLPSRT